MKKNKKFLLTSLIFLAAAMGVFLLFEKEVYAQTQTNECASRTIGAPCNNNTGVCRQVPNPRAPAIMILQCLTEEQLQQRNQQNPDAARLDPGTNTEASERAAAAQNNQSLWAKILGAPINALVNISFFLVAKVLGGITFIIYAIFGFILQLAAWILEGVITSVSFATFTKSEIVKAGWGITRDIANMIFVLAMMIMAFASILQIENYNWKRILPNLLIAALLINFSLVIAGVLIDFSQVLTKYFFNASTGQGLISVKVAKALGINQFVTGGFLNMRDPFNLTQDTAGALNTIILWIPKTLLDIIVFLFTAFIFLAGAFFLIIRTVALWFLLIFAPLAWAFLILPGTKKYWNMWWESFGKWLIFGPAYAFLLWLSLQIITRDPSPLMTDGGFGHPPPGFNNISQMFKLHFFMNYVIVLGLLYGSLLVAQKSGVMGAGAVIGIGRSAVKGIGRNVARWAAGGAQMSPALSKVLKAADKIPGLKRLNLNEKWEKRKAEREKEKAEAIERGEKPKPTILERVSKAKSFVAPLLVPEVWKRGIAAARARADARAYSSAQGQYEDLWEGKFSHLLKGKMPPDFYKTMRYQAEVAKKENELASVYKDEDARIAAYHRATDPLEKEALFRLITAVNGLNTMFSQEKMSAHLREVINKDTGEKEKIFDAIALKNYIAKEFGEEAARIATDISVVGISSGHYDFAGMTKFNEKTGKFEMASDEDQKAVALAKASEEEFQRLIQKIHPETLVKFKQVVQADGTVKMERVGELNEIGEAIASKLTIAHADQLGRAQPRTLEVITKAEGSFRKLAEKIREAGEPDRADVIEYFIDTAKMKYEGKGGGTKDFEEWKKRRSSGESNTKEGAKEGSTIVAGTQEEVDKARRQHPPGAFG